MVLEALRQLRELAVENKDARCIPIIQREMSLVRHEIQKNELTKEKTIPRELPEGRIAVIQTKHTGVLTQEFADRVNITAGTFPDMKHVSDLAYISDYWNEGDSDTWLTLISTFSPKERIAIGTVLSALQLNNIPDVGAVRKSTIPQLIELLRLNINRASFLLAAFQPFPLSPKE